MPLRRGGSRRQSLAPTHRLSRSRMHTSPPDSALSVSEKTFRAYPCPPWVRSRGDIRHRSAAEEGLQLIVTPEGGSKKDAIFLSPAEPPEDVQVPKRAFSFLAGPLTSAGSYEMVAQFSETRPEIARSNKKAVVR